jgi:hypothetical protein
MLNRFIEDIKKPLSREGGQWLDYVLAGLEIIRNATV